MRPAIPIAVAVLALTGAPSRAQSPAPDPAPLPGGARRTPQGEIVVPMVFPMLGPCRWSDTWGAPRDGGTRRHIGQDLPAEKMRPLVACFAGTWTGAGIDGDNGWSAAYYHMNNDTPGTDDGQGGEEHRVAPGLRPGDRVVAGQLVGYCGDSGNAEETISHLHFELHGPQGPINAAASLRAAQRLSAPRIALPQPEIRPGSGLVRYDAVVRAVDPGRGVAQLLLIARTGPDGKATVPTQPTRPWVRLGDARVRLLEPPPPVETPVADPAAPPPSPQTPPDPEPRTLTADTVGARVIVLAPPARDGRAVAAREVVLLERPTPAAPPLPDLPPGERMRFVDPPSRTDILEGVVTLVVGPDPAPRGDDIEAFLRVDGRRIADIGPEGRVFAWDTRPFPIGEHTLELVRRNRRARREFVTDSLRLLVGNAPQR